MCLDIASVLCRVRTRKADELLLVGPGGVRADQTMFNNLGHIGGDGFRAMDTLAARLRC